MISVYMVANIAYLFMYIYVRAFIQTILYHVNIANFSFLRNFPFIFDNILMKVCD